MRRLWSYIILAFTAIVAMGASFATIFSKVNGNIEYQEGREIVFRVTDKDNEERVFENSEAVENIAGKMKERLDAQDVTQYRISTQGYDTITVELKQDTVNNYQNIETLLAFNGSLALTTKIDSDGHSLIGDAVFTDEKAFMSTEQSIPVIEIPVKESINDIYEAVKTYQSDSKTEAGETSGEGDEAETHYYIYLWHDYDPDYDTFEKTIQGNEDFDEHVAAKLFMKFDVDGMKENDDDTIENLKTYVNVNDLNGNSQYEANEVKAAYDTAKFFVNLLNAGNMDYKVTYLYDNVIDAWTDNVITYGNNIAWSSTLIATLAAIIVLSLLFVVLYRLNSIAIITTTLGSIFGALGMMVVFAAEFNTASLVAYIAVALASIISGVIYNSKFKEECYRGRSLKKANSEAGKKSLLPIVDIHVALIAVGVFSYILGGAIMRGFAAVTVLGGLISLILNLAVLRGMTWLSTNTTALQGKYQLFGVEQSKVPNVIKEEKQNYFGPYADKDFTKKKVPVSIISGLLLAAGIAGLSVFGTVNKGAIFNNGSKALATQIYLETDNKNTGLNSNEVEEALKTIYVYTGEDAANAKSLDTFVATNSDQTYNIDYKTRTDIDYDDGGKEINYTYYIIKLNSAVDFSKYQGYYKIGEEEPVESSEGVEQLIQDRFAIIDIDVSASIKLNTVVSSYEPNFMPVFWGTLVGAAVSGIYLILRYRLSRGIISLIVPLGTAVAVTGVAALTTLPVTSYAALALPFICIFTFYLSIIFMNKERELVLEDKTHDKSPENRKAIMVKAISIAFEPMMWATILALYLGINFFGFGAQSTAGLFAVMAIGTLVSLMVVAVLYGPLSQIFYQLFAKINTEKISSKWKRKKKTKKVQTNKKSAEPEEYIFIGIND